jgi:hypothetical protein
MVITPQTISRNVAFCSQSVNNPMGCVCVRFATPHTLLVFLHSIWVLLILFQKQRVCAASVISRGGEGEKAADESSSLLCLCLRRVVKGHSFRQRRKGTASAGSGWRNACACAAPHEMNKSARTRRLAASEQSKRCSWTSDAACGATALSPPPPLPPDCRLRPQPSPTKGQCLYHLIFLHFFVAKN